MEKLQVKDLLKKVEKLPTLPGIAMRIVQIANNPKSAADDLSRIVQSDMSLAAKVLRMVNSAYYGVRNKVSSVKQAVVILGFNTVKSLALSTAIMDKFAASGTVQGFSRPEFWKHSLGVAVTSRCLGRHLRVPKDTEESYFMGGLLHDIGKVILDQYFHDDFLRVITHMRAHNTSFYNAEMEVNGLTHAEIGGLLVSQWQLPEDLVAAIRFHHAPENREEHQKLISAVHFADILAKTKGFGNGGDTDITGLSEAAVASLGLSEEAIGVLVNEEMEEEYQKAGDFLRLVEKDR